MSTSTLDNAIYDELAEAAKNHKITRALEINVRSALLERDAQAVRYAEQARKLNERLTEWGESYRKIIGDGGCPDEVHCACVPALRDEIKRLRTAIEKAIPYMDEGEVRRFLRDALIQVEKPHV
jgi:hypothetical protein